MRKPSPPEGAPVNPWIELIGTVAATITTFAWLPQIVKIFRERSTHDISLGTQTALFIGGVLWGTYGILIMSWPLIGANAIGLTFLGTIIAFKLRYG